MLWESKLIVRELVTVIQSLIMQQNDWYFYDQWLVPGDRCLVIRCPVIDCSVAILTDDLWTLLSARNTHKETKMDDRWFVDLWLECLRV